MVERTGGSRVKAIAAVIVVAAVLVGTVGLIFISAYNASARSLTPMWLDDSEVYGNDQLTMLTENSHLVFASAKGIENDGEEVFTVRAYEGTSGKAAWTRSLSLGNGSNWASAVAADEKGVAAVGAGIDKAGRQQLMIAYFNADNGTMLWNRTEGQSGGFNVGYDIEIRGNVVYVAASVRSSFGQDLCSVRAYNATNGIPIWSHDMANGGGENAALAISVSEQGVLVTGYLENETGTKSMFLACLDLASGAMKWNVLYDAGYGDNRGTELVISNNIAVVAGYGRTSGYYASLVRAYQISDGSLLWSMQEDETSMVGDLAVSGSNLLVAGIYDGLYSMQCYEIATGALRWQSDTANLGEFNYRAAVDVEGSVVCAAYFSQNITAAANYVWSIEVCQYSLNSGKELASKVTTGTGKTTFEVDILAHGSKVYFTTSTGTALEATAASAATGTTVAIDGYNITINGERFIFKGVNYSPAPIGSNNKWCPWGDWFQTYWKSIYERDIPAMKAAGVNVIRLYGMTAFAWDDPQHKMIDHSGFYKMLSQYGIYVIPSVYTTVDNINSYDPSNWDAQDTMKQWKGVIAEAKDKPAVIGWTVGNELNSNVNINDADWWAKYNDLIGHVKQLSPGKFTMATLQDQSEMGGAVKPIRIYDSAMTNLDVWGVNSYRGLVNVGFDTLFSTHKQNSHKPLLITEFGPPASTRSDGKIVLLPDNAKATADYIKAHWTGHADSIMNNTDVCSGGFVFVWTDEWYKMPSGQAYEHDPSNVRGDAFPGGWWDEEWFGLNGVTVDGRDIKSPDPGRPDILVPRAAVAMLASLWVVPSPPILGDGGIHVE